MEVNTVGAISTAKKCVGFLITDMCGFTKTVKKCGPIHFGSLIMKQRFIVQIVLDHYGTQHKYNEGDDVIAILDSGRTAMMAALEITRLILEYNSTQQKRFQINLSGVGCSQGNDYILTEGEGKIFGECYSAGFRLGEDIVRDFEVCITEELYESVKDDPEFEQIQFILNESLKESEGLVYRNLRGQMKNYACSLHPWKPTGEYEDIFQQRLEPGANLEELDAQINARCRQDGTVVMYGIQNSRHDLKRFVRLYETALSLILSACRQYNGKVLEPSLILFDSPTDGVLACFQARKNILEFNEGKEKEEQIDVNGFGVHSGSMLYYPNAFHMGDPINTASKMGEDNAQNMEILVSKETYALIEPLVGFEEEFRAGRLKEDLYASDNHILCYSFPVLAK